MKTSSTHRSQCPARLPLKGKRLALRLLALTVEPGEVDVRLGGSSDSIRLHQSLTIIPANL